MAEWYRRKTWSNEDEAEFLKKLGRARKDGRAQYLRIQASVLFGTKEPKNVEAALVLLNKLIAEFPENRLEKAPVFDMLGQIFHYKGQTGQALNSYMQAINFETEFPNVRTQAYLNFAELIVKGERYDQYDFLENLLLSNTPRLAFPDDRYKVFSILGIINYYHKRTEEAEHYLKLAEENADSKTSGFRYHKDLGVVINRDYHLDRIVKKMQW